jgi:uncharacterized protein
MSNEVTLEPLETALRAELIRIARTAIENGAATRRRPPPDLTDLPEPLRACRASFVTLKRHGRLRGCIGTLEAYRPLAEDVADNALAAGFRDPRFPAVSAAELPDLKIQISVLTKPEEIRFDSEADLLARLHPGLDGVILVEGRRRGTFLPSVWEELPDPADFLHHLKLKAGLPENYYSGRLKAYRYRVEHFGED